MPITIRHARPDDIDAVMAIERAGFTPAEAASTESMTERIAVIPDTFYIAELDGQVAGFVVGPAISARYLTDDLFEHLTPNLAADKNVAILSIAVAPAFRSRGIGAKLLETLATDAKAQGRELISLTCLERLVPYYARYGYVNEGVADSTHAGEVWYNMVRSL